MNVLDIQYNSWLTSFKRPFGAIQENKTVAFSIKVASSEEILSVSLMMRKNHEIEETELAPLDNNFYQGSYLMTLGSGIYRYCFKIRAKNQEGQEFTIYYGHNHTGGEGKQYFHEAEIEWYQMTCYKEIDAAPQWYREGIAYQIFPDRFFNGNPGQKINQPKKNSFIYGTKEDTPCYVRAENGDILRWDFYGGNFKGIKKKIPYLKELGVTILYLNPIFEAASNHRYDTSDYFNVDPMLGTNQEFKDLLAELHEEGIRVILDGVFSHVGRNSRYFNYSSEYKEVIGAYQSKTSPYYEWFDFIDYPNDYQSWWGIKDLPTINKNKKSYQEFIYGKENSVIGFWQEMGVDGWRLDVVDELPNTFIEGIRSRVSQDSDKVLIGEVWEDATNKVSYNEEKEYASHSTLHGVMNYPLRQQIIDLVNERLSVGDILLEMMSLKENYPEHFSKNLLNNIGTHDTKRILAEVNESIDEAKLALTMMFMLPGVPCVYYGDEVGLTGETDPDNRRYFPWEEMNEELKAHSQELIHLRKNTRLLIDGHCHLIWNHQNNLFGIHRYEAGEDFLCLFNFSAHDQEILNRDWSCGELECEKVQELVNRLKQTNHIVKKKSHLILS